MEDENNTKNICVKFVFVICNSNDYSCFIAKSNEIFFFEIIIFIINIL